MVVPEEGNVLVVTVDSSELLDIARARVTRGFSETECETYRITRHAKRYGRERMCAPDMRYFKTR